jgi:hypothetical protein
LTYFIRQLVTSVPFLFPIPRGIGFKPYLSDEFSGEMMMGLVFLGSQLHLIQKIDLLSTRLHHRFFEDEKYINGTTKKKLIKKK